MNNNNTQVLNVSYMASMTDAIMVSLAQTYSALHVVILRECRRLTDKSLLAITAKHHTLRYTKLDFRYYVSIPSFMLLCLCLRYGDMGVLLCVCLWRVSLLFR
jgi:hypothetical protein